MAMRIASDNAQYSSVKAILHIAGPACILNAAAPITAVVQTALIGQYVGTAALGAFGAVSVTAGFATRVFNFLVDGVSAKTGKSVGLKAWDELGGRVKMSLGFALAAGVVASSMLAALIKPVSVDILKLTDEVQQEAALYWWLRVALVPILLLNMSVSGILQGFRHVRISAAINTIQALLEMGGSAVVLMYGLRIGQHDGLVVMGVVTLITQAMALVAGFASILLLPPPEACGQFTLWEDWFGSRSKKIDFRQGTLHEPLLLGNRGRRDSAASIASFQGTHLSSAKDIQQKDLRRTYEAVSPGSVTASIFGSPMQALDSPSSDLYFTPQEGSSYEVRKNGYNESGSTSTGSVGPLSLPHLEETTPPTSSAAPAGSTAGSTADGTVIVVHQNGDIEAHTLIDGIDVQIEHIESETLLDFVRDGLNMFIRSMILQTTFFASLVAASRLGTPSLAAHSIVNQLWVLISYAVDGFAAAGIVLGSRLAAQAHDPLHAADAKRHLQKLITRVLSAGLIAGFGAAVVFAAGRDVIMAWFTEDKETAAVLTAGTWGVLVLSQPINGLIFVYDGLMMASQSFKFIRNYILLGFIIVFCPLLATEEFVWQALWGVWLTNAAVNVWRLAGAAYLIHIIFMKEFDSQLGSRTPSAATLQ